MQPSEHQFFVDLTAETAKQRRLAVTIANAVPGETAQRLRTILTASLILDQNPPRASSESHELHPITQQYWAAFAEFETRLKRCLVCRYPGVETVWRQPTDSMANSDYGSFAWLAATADWLEKPKNIAAAQRILTARSASKYSVIAK